MRLAESAGGEGATASREPREEVLGKTGARGGRGAAAVGAGGGAAAQAAVVGGGRLHPGLERDRAAGGDRGERQIDVTAGAVEAGRRVAVTDRTDGRAERDPT